MQQTETVRIQLISFCGGKQQHLENKISFFDYCFTQRRGGAAGGMLNVECGGRMLNLSNYKNFLSNLSIAVTNSFAGLTNAKTSAFS